MSGIYMEIYNNIMIAARQGIIAGQKALVDITIYSSQGYTGLNGYTVWYSTAECSGWSAVLAINNCPNSTTCAQYGAITVQANTTVYITVKECTATFIQFNAADNTATCPANEGNYCHNTPAGGFDICIGTAFSFDSGNVNKNIAITVYVISGGKGADSYAEC